MSDDFRKLMAADPIPSRAAEKAGRDVQASGKARSRDAFTDSASGGGVIDREASARACGLAAEAGCKETGAHAKEEKEATNATNVYKKGLSEAISRRDALLQVSEGFPSR